MRDGQGSGVVNWDAVMERQLREVRRRLRRELLKNRYRAQDYASKAKSTRKAAKEVLRDLGGMVDIPLEDLAAMEVGDIESISDAYRRLEAATSGSFLTKDNLTYLSEEAERDVEQLEEALQKYSRRQVVVTPNRRSIERGMEESPELLEIMKDVMGEDNQFVLPQHIQRIHDLSKEHGIPFNLEDHPRIEREMKMLGTDSLFFDRPVLSKVLNRLPRGERQEIADGILKIAEEKNFHNLEDTLKYIDNNRPLFSRRFGRNFSPRMLDNIFDDLSAAAPNLSDLERRNWRYVDLNGVENLEGDYEALMRRLRDVHSEGRAPLSSANSEFSDYFSANEGDASSVYEDAIAPSEEDVLVPRDPMWSRGNIPVQSAASEGAWTKAGRLLGKGARIAGKVLEPLAVVDMASQGAMTARNYREQIEEKGLIPGLAQGMYDNVVHGGRMITGLLDDIAEYAPSVAPVSLLRPEEGGYSGLLPDEPMQGRFNSTGGWDDVQNYGKSIVNNTQYALTGKADIFREGEPLAPNPFLPTEGQLMPQSVSGQIPNSTSIDGPKPRETLGNLPSLPQINQINPYVVKPPQVGTLQRISSTRNYQF